MVDLCTFLAVFFALGTVLAAPTLESHSLVGRMNNQGSSAAVPSQPTLQGRNPESLSEDEKQMIRYLEDNGHTSDEKSHGYSVKDIIGMVQNNPGNALAQQYLRDFYHELELEDHKQSPRPRSVGQNRPRGAFNIFCDRVPSQSIDLMFVHNDLPLR
ncbi:hypothetical protein DFJ43DRAFT_1151202 [Lentinula guzmanii]|uniref:Uncharacterized protein n=1 Tax=Lentinula guzmanii TaxID=2804957 RepID=A0AA38JGP5_9AGAR|nr:hypothetical protein DFJ43DRAFT_1151202 [Lentinula guzmanii]